MAASMTSIDHTFNLPPFPAFPSVLRYVPLGSLDETMIRVGRSIEAREAVSLVIGPPGTGKSLACRLLAKRFNYSHEVVQIGDTPIEDRAALLRHLLHHLGVDHIAGPANDLHLALVDRVCGSEKSGLLIIVDEAQALSEDVLEAIRMTTNIMQDGQPKVTAVVCGGTKLDEVLVNPSMEAFSQRVATRCYLHPMSGDETQQYVSHVIAACGADPASTITPEALSAVHHGCNGVPRLVNQLMTQAIDVAEERDQALIDEAVIDQAWATLQQLPTPMINEPKVERPGQVGDAKPSVIEFGELSAMEPSDEFVTDPATPLATSEAANNETTELEVAESTGEIEICGSGAQWVGETDCEEADCEIESDVAQAELDSIRLLTPDANDLFGNFGQEEDLNIGASASEGRQDLNAQPIQVLETCSAESCDTIASDSQVAEHHADAQCETAAAQTCCNDAPDPQLESMLHQEIVGMSTTDDSASILPDSANIDAPNADSPNVDEPIVDSPKSDLRASIPVDETIQFAADEDSASSDQGEQINQAAIRFVEDSTMRPLADAFQNGPGLDDSDLLVIEDELDLRIADDRDRKTISMSDSDPNLQAKAVSVDFKAMLTKMRTGS